MHNLNWTLPTLETPRLVLRRVTEADAPALFAACSDPRLTEYTLFETHQSVADTLAFVRQYAGPNYAQGVPDPLVAAWKDAPDQPVGCTGCRWASDDTHTMELGYWVAVPEWGKGIAGEMAGRVTDYVFETMGINRLQSRVIAGNSRSERVLQKLGFACEGTYRQALHRRGRFWDLRVYALLREEWDAKRAAGSPRGPLDQRR